MAQRKDFIDFGSPAHAALLGLRKVEKNEECEYEFHGWTLVDVTQWGPNALPAFIKAQLIQRVGELTTKPTVPADAQPIWIP